jgi:predicted nucleotide-binding protein
MKRLSNSELRTLYLRRGFLQNFIQISAAQGQANIGDYWRDSVERMNIVRDEIKDIVNDPQFDTLVTKPRIKRTGAYSFSGSETIVNVIASATELITYIDGVLAVHITPKSRQLKQDPKRSGRVFIGHGRNEIVRSKVKDFIRDRCRLQPLVLQELPSSGLTVIEKLEKFGRTADYAVLILTGDDVMAEADSKRARQNVIQELGWFQGVIGRKRTAILLQNGVEIASNVAGVVYLGFSENSVEMTFEGLRQEFEDAGLMETG